MKTCKDCKHCDLNVDRPDLSHCTHPSYLTVSHSFVTGEEVRSWKIGGQPLDYEPFCESMRKYRTADDCGPDARLFEACDAEPCDDRR